MKQTIILLNTFLLFSFYAKKGATPPLKLVKSSLESVIRADKACDVNNKRSIQDLIKLY